MEETKDFLRKTGYRASNKKLLGGYFRALEYMLQGAQTLKAAKPRNRLKLLMLLEDKGAAFGWNLTRGAAPKYSNISSNLDKNYCLLTWTVWRFWDCCQYRKHHSSDVATWDRWLIHFKSSEISMSGDISCHELKPEKVFFNSMRVVFWKLRGNPGFIHDLLAEIPFHMLKRSNYVVSDFYWLILLFSGHERNTATTTVCFLALHYKLLIAPHWIGILTISGF